MSESVHSSGCVSLQQESDVTAADSPFELQGDKRARRPRKRHDKPPDHAVAAN